MARFGEPQHDHHKEAQIQKDLEKLAKMQQRLASIDAKFLEEKSRGKPTKMTLLAAIARQNVINNINRLRRKLSR